MTKPGAFIVIEGIDGSGTTTQAAMLAAKFRESGSQVVVTNEPSSGPVGSLIRLALTRRVVGASGDVHGADPSHADGAPASVDPTTIALLYAADRIDHVRTVVEPARNAGRHVISDRYLLSSLAYQGMTHDAKWVLSINSHAPKPDLTIFLEIDVDTALERMRRSRWTRDVFEHRDVQVAVRDRYEQAISAHAAQLGRIEKVNAARSPEEVAADVWRVTQSLSH